MKFILFLLTAAIFVTPRSLLAEDVCEGFLEQPSETSLKLHKTVQMGYDCLKISITEFQNATAALEAERKELEAQREELRAHIDDRFSTVLALTPERVTFKVSKNQRGSTVKIPESDIIRLCSDDDGCDVRIGMYNWDGTERVASRQFLLHYNPSSGNWRASLGDTSGSNSDNVAQNVNVSWACILTDGDYSNFTNQGDGNRDFGLLSWTAFNADCRLTIID